MTNLTLSASLLTAEGFWPFGDVIEAGVGSSRIVNEDRGIRFDPPVRLEFRDGSDQPVLSVYRISASPLPLRVQSLERHAGSSQCFVPMTASRYLVVACLSDADGKPRLESLAAFVAQAHQAINYHCGVWHLPLVALDAPADFTMMMWQNADPMKDCETFLLSDSVRIDAPS